MINHQSVTEQVVAYFKDNIESGHWEVGQKIPSENVLTKTLGVSRATIRQAVSQLAGIGQQCQFGFEPGKKLVKKTGRCYTEIYDIAANMQADRGLFQKRKSCLTELWIPGG